MFCHYGSTTQTNCCIYGQTTLHIANLMQQSTLFVNFLLTFFYQDGFLRIQIHIKEKHTAGFPTACFNISQIFLA